eukprot:5631246-Karenia_brevis.AAC.1
MHLLPSGNNVSQLLEVSTPEGSNYSDTKVAIRSQSKAQPSQLQSGANGDSESDVTVSVSEDSDFERLEAVAKAANHPDLDSLRD